MQSLNSRFESDRGLVKNMSQSEAIVFMANRLHLTPKRHASVEVRGYVMNEFLSHFDQKPSFIDGNIYFLKKDKYQEFLNKYGYQEMLEEQKITFSNKFPWQSIILIIIIAIVALPLLVYTFGMLDTLLSYVP